MRCAVFIAVSDVDSASVEDSRDAASFSGVDGDSSVEEEDVVKARESVEVREPSSKSPSSPQWERILSSVIRILGIYISPSSWPPSSNAKSQSLNCTIYRLHPSQFGAT